MTLNTVTGRHVDILKPKVEDINIIDIARGLSNSGHFGGQTPKFFSIAEHSLMVADLSRSLEGLLHDSAEAYMGDLIRPLQDIFPDFKEKEKILLHTIASAFNLEKDFAKNDIIKKYDTIVLAMEWDEFFPKLDYNPFMKGIESGWEYEQLKKFTKIRYYDPNEAYLVFCERYLNLC